METPVKSSRGFSIAALLCGIWFLLTGWIWSSLACLVFSYPVAILGLFFWRAAKKRNPMSTLNHIAFWLLGLGLGVSLGAIFVFK